MAYTQRNYRHFNGRIIRQGGQSIFDWLSFVSLDRKSSSGRKSTIVNRVNNCENIKDIEIFYPRYGTQTNGRGVIEQVLQCRKNAAAPI